MNSNLQNLLYTTLIPKANESQIQSKLAAGILKGSKIIGNPQCNSPRNICRGVTCGSLHAEANAILNHFGRKLRYDPKNGWCFLRSERKEPKV